MQAALARFKLAVGTPMGYQPGVADRGEEMSHGTDLIPYAVRSRDNADVAEHQTQEPYNADWLWHNQDLSQMGPGTTGGGGFNNGGYGEEVIG